MQSIAEVPTYFCVAERLLSEQERLGVIDYLAMHPLAGKLLQGTGGIRKLRWRRGSRGKSGGVRIIYYYHSERMPLYLLAMFAKGDKASLSAAERHELKSLVNVLVTIWKERVSL